MTQGPALRTFCVIWVVLFLSFLYSLASPRFFSYDIKKKKPKGERTMASLETKYLGLSLKSPVIVGSSPLTQNVVSLEKCEEAGAGAVVLKSIFE